MAADVSLGLRFVFSNTQVTQIMRAIMNRMITSLIRGAERRTLLEDKILPIRLFEFWSIPSYVETERKTANSLSA